MFNNLGLEKLAKQAFESLVSSIEDDAEQFERRAKRKRKEVAAFRKLMPVVLKMFEPPKPFKPFKYTKAQKKILREQGAAFMGAPLTAVPPAPPKKKRASVAG